MLIDCHHCGHVWDYSGSKPVGGETNCPDCKYKTRIEPIEPATVFEQLAPRLSADEVARIVLEKIVVDELRDDVAGIHVYGSFVRGDKQLDYDDNLDEPTHPADASDLDVWVEMDGWGERALSTRFTGSQHGLVCRLIAQGAIDHYGGSGEMELTETPIDVRGDATVAERETIRRAERTVVSLTEQDATTLGFRVLDLSLGGAGALDRELGDDPSLTVWP